MRCLKIRGKAFAVFLTLILIPGISAATSIISPSSPEEIVLNSSNNYEVKRQFDGSGSTPASVTYSWSHVEQGVTKTGPRVNFTFDTSDPSTNTITLVVSSGSGSDSTRITQTLRDVPRITYTDISRTSIDLGESQGKVEFRSAAVTAFNDDLSYEWVLGNGTVASNKPNFTYDFNNTGDYTLTVKVTDGAGYHSSKKLKAVKVVNSTETEEKTGTGTNSPGGGYR